MNTSDSGTGSLRQAILDANALAGADTITFASGVTGTITLTSGTLSVTGDLTVSGPGASNLTISGGGAVRVLEFSAGITASVTGVTISDGLSADAGGILNNGTLALANVTVSGNSSDGVNVWGGGVSNWGALTMTNSVVSGNSTPIGSGAGIGNLGTATVAGSTFSGNSAWGYGGAIVNLNNGTLTVSGSTFSGNSATIYGGAIGGLAGTATLADSTFSSNSAIYGGAIMSGGGGATMTISNSTLSANNASSEGGGIRNFSNVIVTNATLSGNSAPSGGGVYNDGALTLKNTIVANSPAGGNCAGAITDGGGNLSWSDQACPGLNQDPLLDPAGLQNNGGPTQTIALLAGSPAIDAAVLAPCPATDQRGVSRPQGGGCDIGAYERVGYAFTGFFAPVDNPPALNAAKAGSGIPVKFSLGGNQGLNIFAVGYPKSEKITCDASATLDDIEQTVTAGGSSLSYDATADRYTYVWKTDKAWAGTCRRLTVRLSDSSDHVAYFKLSK